MPTLVTCQLKVTEDESLQALWELVLPGASVAAAWCWQVYSLRSNYFVVFQEFKQQHLRISTQHAEKNIYMISIASLLYFWAHATSFGMPAITLIFQTHKCTGGHLQNWPEDTLRARKEHGGPNQKQLGSPRFQYFPNLFQMYISIGL